MPMRSWGFCTLHFSIRLAWPMCFIASSMQSWKMIIRDSSSCPWRMPLLPIHPDIALSGRNPKARQSIQCFWTGTEQFSGIDRQFSKETNSQARDSTEGTVLGLTWALSLASIFGLQSRPWVISKHKVRHKPFVHPSVAPKSKLNQNK